jgi:hypothetical protein
MATTAAPDMMRGASLRVDCAGAELTEEVLANALLQEGESLLTSMIPPFDWSVTLWLCPPSVYDTVSDDGTGKVVETDICPPHPAPCKPEPVTVYPLLLAAMETTAVQQLH